MRLPDFDTDDWDIDMASLAEIEPQEAEGQVLAFNIEAIQALGVERARELLDMAIAMDAQGMN